MISKIEIKNFQNIVEADIDLDPGINIFVGGTDQGKSAIVKALYWLAFNRPQGDEFIRKIKETLHYPCSVSVTLDERDKIIRKRSKEANQYIVNGIIKKALRTEVPEEVTKIFNITETNIQTQFAPFFFLSSSPGQVAKQLNQAVGLEEIDSVLARINSMVRESSASINSISDQIKEKETEISKLKYVEELDRNVENLDRMFRRYEDFENQLLHLSTLTEKHEDYLLKIQETQQIIQAENDIKRLSKIIENSKSAQSELDHLEDLADSMIEISDRIEQFQDYLEAEVDVSKLIQLLQDLKRGFYDLELIEGLTFSFKRATDDIQKTNKQQKEAEKHLANLMKGMEFCPLCHKPL